MLNHDLIINSRRSRCDAVDFLRGFSIFTIVLMHLIQGFCGEMPVLLYQAAALGGTGAHVFIFCSGFGLYRARLRAPLPVSQFFLRRLGKVYLPYLPVVLLSAFVPALCADVDRLGAIAAHVLLYKMFVPAYMESFGMQFWFVSTIIQFYLIFLPLCALRKRIGMRGLLLTGLGISVAWWILLAATGLYTQRVFNSFFAQFLWEFLLGMAVAEYLHQGNTLRLRPVWLMATALVGLGIQGALSLWGSYTLRLFNDIPALFGYGALALLLYHFGRGWLDRLFLALSSISYSWYLTHILVFSLVFTAGAEFLPTIALAVAAFLLSLAAAWLYAKVMVDGLSKLRKKIIGGV